MPWPVFPQVRAFSSHDAHAQNATLPACRPPRGAGEGQHRQGIPLYSVYGRCRPRDGPERTRPAPADHWFVLVVNRDDTQPRAPSSSLARAWADKSSPAACPARMPAPLGWGWIEAGPASMAGVSHSSPISVWMRPATWRPPPPPGWLPCRHLGLVRPPSQQAGNPFISTHQRSR
jgi:hypothetical protein